jgi:hypothetical protein
LGKFVVTTCGSGVTASVLYFALELIGVSRKAVYDGSWVEFATRDNVLTEKGLVSLVLDIQKRLSSKLFKLKYPAKVYLE